MEANTGLIESERWKRREERRRRCWEKVETERREEVLRPQQDNIQFDRRFRELYYLVDT